MSVDRARGPSTAGGAPAGGHEALRVAFLWHMHQPDYRHPESGEEVMPWVRLHALKDYYDVARIVGEAPPGVRMTFNLTPVLLVQIQQLEWRPSQDPFSRLSRKPVDRLRLDDKLFILQHFFSVNEDRMLRPLDRYAWLYEQVRAAHGHPERVLQRFSDQDYLDLQVLFNLAWSGRTLRERPPVRRLLAKGRGFTEVERDELLAVQDAFVAEVLPLYRRLADEGRIELSTTPLNHPILPLLCDLQAAREANPHCSVDGISFRHPEDAREQVARARALAEGALGRRPEGMWPSEGSVSEEAVRLMGAEGVRWIATDRQVLERSLALSGRPSDPLAHLTPWRLRGEGNPATFFRDTTLSDLIGFTYSRWEPEAAVRDLLHRARSLLQSVPDPGRAVLPVILDGENAWEFYADHGVPFLTCLMSALAAAPDVRAVTMSEALGAVPARELPRLRAGSWIRADFDTWAGHPEKNRAWVAIVDARCELEDHRRRGDADPAALANAYDHLLRAEGSDWFWWLGDDHYTPFKREFDELFRLHVVAVWRALGVSPPAYLFEPIADPARAVAVETREPFQLIRPTLDGEAQRYYEWMGAGYFDVAFQKGAIFTGEPLVRRVHYGFDEGTLYLRLTPREGRADDVLGEARVEVCVDDADRDRRWTWTLEPGGSCRLRDQAGAEAPPGRVGVGLVVELGIPLASMDLAPGRTLRLHVEIVSPDGRSERLPLEASIQAAVPPPEFNRLNWSL